MSERRKQNIVTEIFWYWIIIVVWQYVRPVENRSVIDTLVKMGMFAAVMLYAIRNSKGLYFRGRAGTCIPLFIISQIITLTLDSGSIALGNVITIVFMLVEIIAFLALLDDEVVTEEELIWFCRALVIVAITMCIYNMAFQTSNFVGTFRAGASYGNECRSYLYSNHEFGVYVAAAIISLLWLKIKDRLGWGAFFLCALLFGTNLLSSYSRTAIAGCVAAVFILLFFYNKTIFSSMFVLFGAVLLFIRSNARLNNIVFDKLMKGSFQDGVVFDDGRSSMYAEEFQRFMNGNFVQKLFGRGHGFSYDSAGHNAYLSVLLIGGIVMFLFFIAVIIMVTKFSFKTMKVDKSVGSLMIGYIVFCVLYMVAQTPILFFSPMDNFFITVLTVLIPKYIYNYYCKFYGTEYGYCEVSEIP